MQAYAIDLRERVLAALDAGMTYTQASMTFDVSVSAIVRWRRRMRQTGSCAPRTSPGRPAVVAQALALGIETQVAAHPDATLAEHAALWEATTGTPVSPSSVSRALVAARLTRKKRV
jgi:transposase